MDTVPPDHNDPCPHSAPAPCRFRTASREQAWAWSLVLTARDIPHSFSSLGNRYTIEVGDTLCSMALAELNAYETENRNWPPVRTTSGQHDGTEMTVWTLFAVACLMGLTFSPEFHVARGAGAAWAGKIMQGEWWRAATALTLHTDPAHLMGNMIIGGFIMVHACNYIGAGLAWFLTCLSGVTGNLLNAAIQPAHHIAVGSSTAVFGLTGAVTAFRAVQDRSSGIRGFALPLGAGIALLGFTGSGGEHTDIGAHACGFISGVVSGAMAGFMVQVRGFPSRKTDMLLGAAAFMIPVIAWFAVYMEL